MTILKFKHRHGGIVYLIKEHITYWKQEEYYDEESYPKPGEDVFERYTEIHVSGKEYIDVTETPKEVEKIYLSKTEGTLSFNDYIENENSIEELIVNDTISKLSNVGEPPQQTKMKQIWDVGASMPFI